MFRHSKHRVSVLTHIHQNQLITRLRMPRPRVVWWMARRQSFKMQQKSQTATIYSRCLSAAMMKGKILWLGWMEWLLGQTIKKFLKKDLTLSKLPHYRRHSSTCLSSQVLTHNRLSCMLVSNSQCLQENSQVGQLIPHVYSHVRMSSIWRWNSTFWLLRRPTATSSALAFLTNELVTSLVRLSAKGLLQNLACAVLEHLNRRW